MGVHGLTTFVAQYHQRYKEKIYLRDCPVVIDGCNLMYFLYFDGQNSVVNRGPSSSKKTSSSKKLPNAYLFGGDLEQYAQNVRYFFQQLKQCDITGIVLLDGAYDMAKIPTVYQRFGKSVKDNITSSSLNEETLPGKSYTPVFLKTVFLEVLSEQKITHYQTLGEADSTIAFIARLLNDCPILSSDSDFFIYTNAVALSLGSLKFAKAVKGKNTDRGKAQMLSGFGTKATKEDSTGDKVWTLQSEYVLLPKLCKEEFNLRDPRLLPLASVILGSDYIQKKVFKNFQSFKANGNLNSKGGRISSIMKWLGRQPNLQSAVTTLLGFVSEDIREQIGNSISMVIDMYEGVDGEIRIWQLLKKDLDISRWINVALERKLKIDEEPGGTNVTVATKDNEEVSEAIRETAQNAFSFLNEDRNKDLKDFYHISLNSHNRDPVVAGSHALEESILTTKRLEAKISECSLPPWFLQIHTSCHIQTYILNIHKNGMVLLPPQVELYHSPSAHNLSIPIIRVIAGILCSNDIRPINLLTRSKGNFIQQEVIPIIVLKKFGKLPTLFNSYVPNGKFSSIHLEKRIQIIEGTLELDDNPHVPTYIHRMPASSRIWIIVLLNFVKKQLDLQAFKAYECLSVAVAIFFGFMKSFLVNPGEEKEIDESNLIKGGGYIHLLHKALKAEPKKLERIRQFYKTFENHEEVNSRKFMKSYDIKYSHLLSEYLCLLYHTQMLNNLLDNPFKSPKVRYNLNNFFVYNLAQFIAPKIGVSDNVPMKTLLDILVETIGVEEVRPIVREFFLVVSTLRPAGVTLKKPASPSP